MPDAELSKNQSLLLKVIAELGEVDTNTRLMEIFLVGEEYGLLESDYEFTFPRWGAFLPNSSNLYDDLENLCEKNLVEKCCYKASQDASRHVENIVLDEKFQFLLDVLKDPRVEFHTLCEMLYALHKEEIDIEGLRKYSGKYFMVLEGELPPYLEIINHFA